MDAEEIKNKVEQVFSKTLFEVGEGEDYCNLIESVTSLLSEHASPLKERIKDLEEENERLKKNNSWLTWNEQVNNLQSQLKEADSKAVIPYAVCGEFRNFVLKNHRGTKEFLEEFSYYFNKFIESQENN